MDSATACSLGNQSLSNAAILGSHFLGVPKSDSPGLLAVPTGHCGKCNSVYVFRNIFCWSIFISLPLLVQLDVSARAALISFDLNHSQVSAVLVTNVTFSFLFIPSTKKPIIKHVGRNPVSLVTMCTQSSWESNDCHISLDLHLHLIG